MYGNLPNPYISDVKLFLNKNHKKMKITEFGVQELNQEEMKKVDGGFGFFMWGAVLGYIIGDILFS